MEPELDPRVRRTRADVVVAAGHILLEEGWDNLTHARVASRAGYSKATLYRHWREQADLVELALEHVNGLPHSTPTGDVASDLTAELSAFQEFLVRDGFGPALAALAHHAPHDERLAELRDQLLVRGLSVLRSVLVQARDARLLRPDLDVDVAASMLAGAMIHRVVISGDQAGPEFIDQCVTAVLAGTGGASASLR